MSLLDKMKHSPVRNYAGVPGLTSWLIGTPGPHGVVRLMECSRDHHEAITPHSHRFDFECRVIKGSVTNFVWREDTECPDRYEVSELIYQGAPGEYAKSAVQTNGWRCEARNYGAGEEYAMSADEVHSIFFKRDTSVLFFEGPKRSHRSIILQPVVDGVVVPTFKVEPWMFQKGHA